nr:MAG TPA: minor capsid protein [Microviridae sp.]
MTTGKDAAKVQSVPAVGNLDSALSRITRTASENTARSAQLAAEQRDWQERQNALAMQFNAQEAAKSRSWQEYMSNTAHQREIKDLKAAGLNPVLSAMGGNGAAVTSGATASGVTSAGAKGEVDTSANAALVQILGSFLSAQTQLQTANVNARTQEAVADKYTAMEKLVAQIGADASKYGAQLGYAGSKYNANMHYALGKYQTDKGFENQVFLEQNYPSNYVQAVNSILKAFGIDVTGGSTSGEGSVSAEQYAKLMEKYNAALLGSGPKPSKHQR